MDTNPEDLPVLLHTKVRPKGGDEEETSFVEHEDEEEECENSES